MSAADEYRCAGCGQLAHQNLPTRFEFDLFYCRRCGLGQASTFSRTDDEDYYYFEDSYDEQYAEQDRAHLSELLRRFFAPEFFRGKRAIDVGPGTGELLQLLLNAGAEPLGVEINDLGVSMLVEKELSVVHGVLGKSASQKAGDADCVFALNVLEHVDNLKSAIADLSRMVRSGGHLLVEVPNFDSIYRRLAGKYWPGFNPFHHFYFTGDGLAKLFSEAFQPLRIETACVPVFREEALWRAGLRDRILKVMRPPEALKRSVQKATQKRTYSSFPRYSLGRLFNSRRWGDQLIFLAQRQ